MSGRLEEIIEAALSEQDPSPEDIEIPAPRTGTTGPGMMKKRAEKKAKRLASTQQAVQANTQLLAKHGLTTQSEIGRGSNGVAYSLPDGRVLKVTADETEALASFKLQGRNTRYIARIFSVFRFPNSDVYGIVQEHLQPLSPQEKEELNQAMFVIDRTLGKDMTPFSDGFDALATKAMEGADDVYDEGDIQRALIKLKSFDMHEMMDELIRRGIRFHDYHSGNIMKRGDQYVVTDLGVSEVFGKGVGMPPVLEKTEEDPGTLAPSDDPDDPVRRTEDAEDLLLAHKDLLIKHGIRPVRALGLGSMGVAFETADGKVLKVTGDDSEAIASFKIQGQRIPHVVQIHKVFRFPQKLRGDEVYGILQDKLRGMPGREKNILHWANKTVQALFDQKVGRAYSGGWKNFTQMVRAKYAERPSEELKANLARAISVYQKFGLDKMMDGLLAAGVRFYDYHVGNIMMGPDGPTVTDIGVSATVGGAQPPQLEAVNEALANQVVAVHAPLQPFAKRQAEFVRGLAGKAKVVLLLGRGPLPFEVMREVVKASLPDQEDRVELFDVGDMDTVRALEHAEQSGSKGLRPGVGFELYSVDGESARDSLSSSGVFGNSAVIPRPLDPKLAMDKASLQAVRSGGLKNVMDPHMFSDQNRVQRVSALLQQREMVESVVRLLEKTTAEWGGEAAATKILEFNHKLLAKHLKQTPTVLGQGANGVVFDIGANRVIKVTGDKEDAQAATNLIGKSLQHVVKIHEVLNLHHPDEPSTQIWGIIAEKVEVLDENSPEALEIDRAVRIFRNFEKMEGERIMRLLASNQIDDFFNELRKALAVQKMEELGTVGSAKAEKIKQRLLSQVESEVRELWDTMRKYQILDMVKDLNSAGIQFTDYKSSNIGRRGNDYVVLDIGHRAADQEIGEGVIKEVRLYHATTQRVDSVPEIKWGKAGDYGPGLYLATDRRDVREYGPKVYVAEVQPQKPLTVGTPEADQVATRLAKAIKATEYLDDGSDQPLWPKVMEFAATLIEVGQLSWQAVGSWLVKQGYDCVVVPNEIIRRNRASWGGAEGDFYIVLQPSAIKSWGDPTVNEMGIGGMGGGHMVGLGMRSQASPWSTGKVTEPKPPQQLAPDDDEEPSESERLATMVYDVIGSLTGKR